MADEILKISTNKDGNYSFMIAKETSVEEIIFAMTALIKCFNRDKVISKDNAMELFNKYLNDVQYDEVVMDGGLA